MARDGGAAALTFDLEVRQLLQQRALGHQLLVDGVLKAHGAGIGARHRQLRLHGRVDEQGVRCKTPGGARGQRDLHIPAEPSCELQATHLMTPSDNDGKLWNSGLTIYSAGFCETDR